jgi:WD40 repeat protein
VARRLAVLVLLVDQVIRAMLSCPAIASPARASGSVAVVDPQSPGAPTFVTPAAHSAETWCCAWLDNDVFMSGADDCTFKLWDRRTPAAAVCSVRSHDAGVTFLGRAPCAAPADGQLFVSGSYDG